jgi:polyhydroxybutyrate depolymerase
MRTPRLSRPRTTRRLLATGGLAVAIGAGALAVPAAAGSPGRSHPGPNSCAKALTGEQVITVDGASVPVYLPPAARGKRLPLVFLLHGSGSSGPTELHSPDVNGRTIEDLGRLNGFAVAAPNGAIPFNPAPGISGYAWNIPGVPLVGTTTYPPAGTRDDVAFISHVIDAVSRVGCIDGARVYSTGTSGGGRMSSQLACDLADRIAAIAPVSGVRYPLASDTPGRTSTCATRRAVPVIAIHGVNDPINVFAATPPADQSQLPAKISPPLAGSSWSYPAQEAVGRWVINNGCKAQPVTVAMTPNIDRITYGRCRDRADVVLVQVKNGGHGTPGYPVSPSLLGILNPSNTEVNGYQVAWDFLSQYRLQR